MTISSADKAFAKALQLLSYRDHSCREMCRKLKDRGYEETVLEETIKRLIAGNYLDDSAYAIRWARHLACNKLYGNRRIEMGLLEKGFPRELVNPAIARIREELGEKEALDQLLKKKFENLGCQPLDQRDLKRLSQALIRKGYPPELIYDKLKTLQVDIMEDFIHEGL